MRPSHRESHRSSLPARLALACGLLFAVACSGGTEPDGRGNDEYDHDLAPGAAARDLLSADDFDRLVVEVQYVQGFAPTAAGLQHLRGFLEARLNKPGGVEIRVASSPLPIQGQATYTPADVRAIEQQHRTAYTQGTTIATYLLYLDGELEGGPNVLGIAYNNTSMALFAEKIDQHTGGVLQPSFATVEGTVANHEMGHLLGLVNNGTPMQTDHHDEDNGRHCDDPDCLMHFSVRTTDYLDNLLGGTIPTLDADCLADLQANGGQ
jgi:hypothetical protein